MVLVWINLGFWPSIFSGLIYGTAPLVVLSSRMIQAENAIIPCLLAVMIFVSLYQKDKKDFWLIMAGLFSGFAFLRLLFPLHRPNE
jgi:4-amino-4-deoxy-L-arabinose transferase-like glycosyltransferase